MTLDLSPFVYKFKVNESTLCLYHSVTLKKVYMSFEEFDQLALKIKDNPLDEDVQRLKEFKFLVEEPYNKEAIFKALADSLLLKEPDPSISYIVLTGTCNFQCRYCYVENAIKKPNKLMDKATADKVIDIISRISEGKKEYKIIFYGGEPLLNKEIMYYIVENLEKKGNGGFNFGVITNGSLIDEKTAEYFKKHSIHVGLSLDGWKDLDANRQYKIGKETFYSTIRALGILNEHDINAAISCTVTKSNYLYLRKIVEFFYGLGVKGVGFNLILDSTNKDYAVEDPKLLAYYLFDAFKRTTELGMHEDRIEARRWKPFLEEKFKLYDCPAYGQQVFFSPYGTLGPCQAFFTTNEYQQPITKDFNPRTSGLLSTWLKLGGTLTSEECMNCPAIGICGGSCAYDIYTKTGKLGFIDRYFCTFINEILKYMIDFYYDTEIKKFNIHILTDKYISGLEELIRSLNKEEGQLMQINKIMPHIDNWIGYSMMANTKKLGVLNVAVENRTGKVIGFCNITRNNSEYVLGVAVAKEYRRKGVGGMLLSKTLEDTRKIGIRFINAYFNKKNLPSKNLLLKYGFSIDKEGDTEIKSYLEVEKLPDK